MTSRRSNSHKLPFAPSRINREPPDRGNIRESTLEGLDTAARKGKHGGRPPVITDDMLHTVLRRRAGGESLEHIQPDLIIPTGKHKRPASHALLHLGLATGAGPDRSGTRRGRRC